MILKTIGIIAAETTRSSIYIQSMIKYNLIPNFCIFLRNYEKDLPGQKNKKITFRKKSHSKNWSEANLDPNKNILNMLIQNKIKHKIFYTKDINNSLIYQFLKKRREKVFLFSGFGGQILNKRLICLNKKFLHIHGGFLPDYRGSTTNYYSILEKGYLGSSSIFLSAKLDSGKILERKKFSVPNDLHEYDHRYDSASRAKVLVKTLKNYVKRKKWITLKNKLSKGDNYYIIHPVLKNIIISSYKK